jgi:hypothetical protein
MVIEGELSYKPVTARIIPRQPAAAAAHTKFNKLCLHINIIDNANKRKKTKENSSFPSIAKLSPKKQLHCIHVMIPIHPFPTSATNLIPKIIRGNGKVCGRVFLFRE